MKPVDSEGMKFSPLKMYERLYKAVILKRFPSGCMRPTDPVSVAPELILRLKKSYSTRKSITNLE